MRRSLWLVVTVVACSPQRAPAPAPGTDAEPTVPTRPRFRDPTVARIVELGTTESRVDRPLHQLAEVIGPRLTGSHALMQAEQWATEELASFGLRARLEQWGELAVGFDRGPWSGGMVEPEAQIYEFTTPSWTPGTAGPVHGAAIMYPSSVAAVRKNPARYRGAWVVHSATKRVAAIDDALFAAKVAGHVERARDRKGVLVHTTGEHDIEWSSLPRDVRVVLRADQHDDLVRRIAAREHVALELTIDNRFFRGPVPQYNVVADLVGAELPDEYVIVGGHIDSVDGAQGAIDNATGCATTIEAARLLVAAGARPRRTIRFMLWSGEEQGLLGSEAYIVAHPELVDAISAVLVHDKGTNFLSGLIITHEMSDDMQDVFAPVMELDPDKSFKLWYAGDPYKRGSDHWTFVERGIPSFLWEHSGTADYDYTHHTQFDTVEHVIGEYQRHSAMVVAIGALGIANLDHKLDRSGR